MGDSVIGAERISKRTFYLNGGFANPHTFRRMRGGVWHYFWLHAR